LRDLALRHLDGIARRLGLAMPKPEAENIMMQSKQLQSYIRKQPVAAKL
jgi:hypothetical protein